MNILVPTDFSVFAGYAFETALALAAKFEGEIHLFHAANIPDTWKDLKVEKQYSDTIQKSLSQYAQNHMEVLHQKAKCESIKCYAHFSEGIFLESITDAVEQYNIDLVVMGSHGLSGKQEWMIGSNAQKCIRRLRCNVLVVKEHFKNLKYKNVAFVSSLSKEDKGSFKLFLKFIRSFKNVKAHIVCVDTYGWHFQSDLIYTEAIREFEEIAIGFDIETHMYKDYTVDAGVRHFIKEHKIDLVAISNHKRHPLKRFFQGSNVEMLVNHLDVPVLSIDY